MSATKSQTRSDGQARSKSSPTGPKAVYLILYNAISALLWSVVLGRTVLIAAIHGPGQVYTGAGEFTKWTQTLAGLEVLHAAIGKSRKVSDPIRTPQLSILPSFSFRSRPRSPPHNAHASRLSLPPRLGNRS